MRKLFVSLFFVLQLFSAGNAPADSILSWGLQKFDARDFPITNAVAIAAGDSYSLALGSDGSVVGLGRFCCRRK